MLETQKNFIDNLILWKQTNPERLLSVNPVLHCLIDGICDEDCVLSMFKGTPHILQDIWSIVTQNWKRLIHKRDSIGEGEDEFFFRQLEGDWQFPKPSNICINMMPFIMERTFEKCRLPDYLQLYWNELIDTERYEGYACCKLIPDDEIGKVGFLTIHESYVDEGNTQRRGGIHVESPGIVTIASNQEGKYVCLGRACNNETSKQFNNIEHDIGVIGDGHSVTMRLGWGLGGHKESELYGGIYMASNVSNSCKVWNCQISPDDDGDEIIGNLGDVEHLREFLPEGVCMDKNRMYWLTDRTPHESLPLEVGTYRQFFRLVTSEVSVWFEEHSTKNPLGVVPDPDITTVVTGSKFGND